MSTSTSTLSNREKNKQHFSHNIRITCLCNENPLTPGFYIVKLGFTGVFIFLLFLLWNMDCGSSLESPH